MNIQSVMRVKRLRPREIKIYLVTSLEIQRTEWSKSKSYVLELELSSQILRDLAQGYYCVDLYYVIHMICMTFI